jgi:hypothetical protein
VASSPEYFRLLPSNASFITPLYCDLLNRPATAAEQGSASFLTRQDAVVAALGSQEYRQAIVDRAYLHYLRRPPDQSERVTATTALASGRSDEQLAATLLASREYFERLNDGGAVSHLSITSAGRISLTLRRMATLTLVVLRPSTRSAAITRRGAASSVPMGDRIGTVRLGRYRPGRNTIGWNRKLHGHRLVHGDYVLLLQAWRRGRLIDNSDAIPFRQRY